MGMGLGLGMGMGIGMGKFPLSKCTSLRLGGPGFPTSHLGPGLWALGMGMGMGMRIEQGTGWQGGLGAQRPGAPGQPRLAPGAPGASGAKGSSQCQGLRLSVCLGMSMGTSQCLSLSFGLCFCITCSAGRRAVRPSVFGMFMLPPVLLGRDAAQVVRQPMQMHWCLGTPVPFCSCAPLAPVARRPF